VCERETEVANRKKTNADRIRAITDKELAEKIKCPYPWETCIHLNEDYPCSKCKLDWLKQEADG